MAYYRREIILEEVEDICLALMHFSVVEAVYLVPSLVCYYLLEMKFVSLLLNRICIICCLSISNFNGLQISIYNTIYFCTLGKV